jgi:hypothetical protein
LSGKVTLDIYLPWGKSLTYTLFDAVMWRYRSPTIRKLIFDNRDDEEDKTPPEAISTK